MINRFLSIILLIFIRQFSFAGDTLSSLKKQNNYCKNIIGIYYNQNNLNFVFDSTVLKLYCDTIPHVKFWGKVLELSPDSALINIAHNRQCIETVSVKWWASLSDEWKQCYRDSIRKCYLLPDTARILFTTGKGHYYVWDTVFFLIDKAIDVFIQNNVDPWYAQSILLIESPGGNWRSPNGARGYFQLMKKVARKFGLVVNRQIDERLNFEKSAYAASMLIKTICIPETKQILDSLKIHYNENELWFKLFVMHVYHAGAYTVRKAIFNSDCKKPGMELIYCLWQTRVGAFQTASQNYSQLILTAYIKAYQKLDLLKCFR